MVIYILNGTIALGRNITENTAVMFLSAVANVAPVKAVGDQRIRSTIIIPVVNITYKPAFGSMHIRNVFFRIGDRAGICAAFDFYEIRFAHKAAGAFITADPAEVYTLIKVKGT